MATFNYQTQQWEDQPIASSYGNPTTTGGVPIVGNAATSTPTNLFNSFQSTPMTDTTGMGNWGLQNLNIDNSATAGITTGMGGAAFDNAYTASEGLGGNILQTTGAGDSSGAFGNFLSTDKQQGWGGLALQGAGALASSWLGLQNLGVAKDQLAFQKDAFNRNFAEQKANQDKYYADRTAARAAAQQ